MIDVQLCVFSGNDLIGLRQPLAPVADKLLVVRTWHADIHIVVPRYKALMAHSSKHGACPEIIAQPMLTADAVYSLQVADDFLLEHTDIIVGLVV